MSPKQERISLTSALQERTVILQNDCICLWYYPQLGIIHHRMAKAPSSEGFRELLTRGAALVEKHGAKKWLSDDRGNTVLRPSDEEWSREYWLPRVQNGGFRFWAIVLPEVAIGKLNMRRLAEQHKQHGIVSLICSSPIQALDWLKRQEV